jgi:hypothetical protein
MPVFSSDLMNSGTFNMVDKPPADFQTAVLFNRYPLPNRPVIVAGAFVPCTAPVETSG